MSRGLLIALLCVGVVPISLPVSAGSETRTHPQNDRIDTSMIWNFHFEGRKRNSDFLELVGAKEGRNRTLVITKLEMRMRQSTRIRVIEHSQAGERGGKPVWKRTVRRSELFSLGTVESTSKWVVSDYDSQIGLKFKPGTRPALEITQGGGEMAIYAEGYWSRSK